MSTSAARPETCRDADGPPPVVDPVIDLLVELAGGGRALELGIGTGRIALPLARRGVPVHGIELSKAMVARLRAKPDGDHIGVTIGDFATTSVDGTFTVAYLVFNRGSTSTTSRHTASRPITSRSSMGESSASRLPSGTCGRRSST